MEEDFDEGVLTVTDSSGHLNALEGSSNIARVDGRFGKAVDFAGGCLAALDDTEGYLELDGSNFTLEAWIKADAFAADCGIVGKWDDTDDQRSYKLYVDSSAKPNLLLSSSGESSTVVTLTGNTDVPTEEWVHVAAVRQSDQIRLYVNEVVQAATGTFTGAVHDGSASLLVGDGFDGAIDEVRISKADNSGSLNYVVTDYAYNERNQHTTETSGESVKTYSYDKNGNTTDIVEAVDFNGDGVGDVGVSNVHMDYDQLNRMTQYAGPEGTEQFTYRGAEWHRHSANATGFLYDGDNVVADIEAGSVTRTYVTPFLDQNLSITIHGATSDTYYYSHDGLGSVRTLTDSAGAIQNRYDYLPFGGAYAPATTSPVQQRHTYTGRERNPAGALTYYRYRQCVHMLGRFASRDPAGHGYGYVDGSPSLRADPFGLASIEVGVHVQEYDESIGESGVLVEIPKDCKVEFGLQYPQPAKCVGSGKFIGKWTKNSRNVRVIHIEPDFTGPAGPLVASGEFEYLKHEPYDAKGVFILLCLKCESKPHRRAITSQHDLPCKDKPYPDTEYRYKSARAEHGITGVDVYPPNPIPW
jgi:RHS repeat-associated protein